LKEQNELHEVTELKNGTGFGAEFLIRIGRTVWLVLHLEKISKSLEIQEASGNAYATTTSSLPVMVGGDVDLAQGPAWRLGFTGLVGLGLSTRYSQQATSMAAPNITEYDGSPVTLMGRFDGELMFSPTFGAGAYLGYRVLNAPKVAPAVAGRTYPDDPLRDASGASSMLSVNLSGMILGAGLVLRL
jgi:hypothetical protein